MLKTFILVFSVVLMVVNLVLLFQIFCHFKRSMKEQTKAVERYWSLRITFIGLNAAIVSIINIVLRIMQKT